MASNPTATQTTVRPQAIDLQAISTKNLVSREISDKSPVLSDPFANDVVNMTQVDYSPHYAIVGTAVDLERGWLYYTKCTAGVCLWRSDTTGECLERVSLTGACSG